jgi:hypothetical protein
VAVFEPPPTYADVILIEPNRPPRFNPIWLKWFLSVASALDPASGGSGGQIQHNDLGGLQGGTTNQFFHLTTAQVARVNDATGGVHTPTVSAAVNCTGTPTMSTLMYYKNEDRIMIAGEFTATPTAALLTGFEFTLPIPSNFTASNELAGVAFCSAVAGQGAALSASAANNTAVVRWTAVDLTAQTWSWLAQYRVI